MRCSRSSTRTIRFLGRQISKQILNKQSAEKQKKLLFFFLKKVKFLGLVISPERIQPLAKRVKDWKNLKSVESKKGNFPDALQSTAAISRTSMWTISPSTTPFHWTNDHEKLIQSIKDRISEDNILAVPSTDYPLHIHVDSSNVGKGCILIQQFLEGKPIIFFNWRNFDKAEQKMLTLPREFCGLASALQSYEHYIIGSNFPIYFYRNHIPIFYLWGRKGQLSPWLFRYQEIITKIQKLKSFWTPGSNLIFPDILSYNVDNPKDTCNNFYPIHCQQRNNNKVLRLHNDGENFTLNSLSNKFPTKTIQSATDCLRRGRTINQIQRLRQTLNAIFEIGRRL